MRVENEHGPLVQSVVLADESGTQDHPGYGVRVGLTHVHPGGRTRLLWHAVPEVVIMLRGSLNADRGGEVDTVRDGESFTIPPECWHSFENTTTDLATMLFVFGGDPEPVTRWRQIDPDGRLDDD